MQQLTSKPLFQMAAFDVSTLFGDDKVAAAQALASQAKNGGPDFIKEIGLGEALVKVRFLIAGLVEGTKELL